MKRFQYSLLWLLGLMVFVAIACNALVNASGFWAGLLFTVTILALMVAVLGSVYRRGSARAFWLGFAIFGSAYLWLASEPVRSPIPGDALPLGWQLQDGINDLLGTTKLLYFAYHRLVRYSPPPSATGTGGVSPFGGGPVPSIQRGEFMTVGHSLWALLFAYVGGRVARYFYATRDKGS